MEILNNPLYLWLLTRVDSFGCLISIFVLVAGLVGGVGLFIGVLDWTSRYTREDGVRKLKTSAWFIAAAFLFGGVGVLLPSRGDLLLIFGVPAALKTQTVQELQATMPDLAKLLHKQVTDALEEND